MFTLQLGKDHKRFYEWQARRARGCVFSVPPLLAEYLEVHTSISNRNTPRSQLSYIYKTIIRDIYKEVYILCSGQENAKGGVGT